MRKSDAEENSGGITCQGKGTKPLCKSPKMQVSLGSLKKIKKIRGVEHGRGKEHYIQDKAGQEALTSSHKALQVTVKSLDFILSTKGSP